MERQFFKTSNGFTTPPQAGRIAFPFQGFKAPTANTTYTPNQFFDVVIPNYSRGVVRIVAYLLRKTLGWCNANGEPQEEQFFVSYSELVQKAGISREMIRRALDDALAGHLIECVQEGRRKQANDAGQTACYQLCWSSRSYTTRVAEFEGFFEGEGNCTDIPNEFFDVLIPNEPLSVIKVVGSIIRHSIGWQARHGRRRQEVALSYRQIENYGRFGSYSDLAKALRRALERNYVVCLEKGVFNARWGVRRKATYGVCWRDLQIGQKTVAADWSENIISQKTVAAENQSENRSSIGQFFEAADRSEKRSSIKTKPKKETVKQQQHTPEAIAKLADEGFDETTAKHLAEQHSLEEIERQIAWLAGRGPHRSKLGVLRRAIEEGWHEPQKLRATEVLHIRGWNLARHFYAAFGGNKGEPVAEPSARDAELADGFVERLLGVSPTPESIPAWGKELAFIALSQPSPLPALALALRQCGDALLARLESRSRQQRESALHKAREAHYAQYLPLYDHWLKEREQSLRETHFAEIHAFEESREAERAKLATSHTAWDKTALAIFDQSSSRRSALRQYFKLPEFWQWDGEFNNEPFNPTL